MNIIADTKSKIKEGKLQLHEEFFPIRDWIWAEFNLALVYVFRGGFINVEPGHYLESTILFVREDLFKARTERNTSAIRHSIMRQFPELTYDTKFHKQWNIQPKQTVWLEFI
jgi:hypothetical protein